MLGERSQGMGCEVEIDTLDADRDKDCVIVSKPATPVQTPVELPPVESQTTYTAVMFNACRFSRHCLHLSVPAKWNRVDGHCESDLRPIGVRNGCDRCPRY